MTDEQRHMLAEMRWWISNGISPSKQEMLALLAMVEAQAQEIADLTAKIERYKKVLEERRAECDDLYASIDAHNVREERLRAALEQYADHDHWTNEVDQYGEAYEEQDVWVPGQYGWSIAEAALRGEA